jgi:hypothetical protein
MRLRTSSRVSSLPSPALLARCEGFETLDMAESIDDVRGMLLGGCALVVDVSEP